MKIMTCNSTTKVDNKEEFVESVVLFIWEQSFLTGLHYWVYICLEMPLAYSVFKNTDLKILES